MTQNKQFSICAREPRREKNQRFVYARSKTQVSFAATKASDQGGGSSLGSRAILRQCGAHI